MKFDTTVPENLPYDEMNMTSSSISSPLKIKPKANRMMMNTPTQMRQKIVEDGKMIA